jgi:hypothetical protein
VRVRLLLRSFFAPFMEPASHSAAQKAPICASGGFTRIWMWPETKRRPPAVFFYRRWCFMLNLKMSAAPRVRDNCAAVSPRVLYTNPCVANSANFSCHLDYYTNAFRLYRAHGERYCSAFFFFMRRQGLMWKATVFTRSLFLPLLALILLSCRAVESSTWTPFIYSNGASAWLN